MQAIKIPLVPQWNIISSCTSTPDDGLLYIGWETINYIARIQDEAVVPLMKVFHIRQKVKSLDCDHDWSCTRHFAIVAGDNSIQVWDFDEEKAIKGHKAHIKPILGEGDMRNLENVKLCFLKNRKILSIDSQSIVIYCKATNTYIKKKRFISYKHEISILKCSPYDENVVAVGTNRGLIIVVNLQNETVIHNLRGHNTEITSLSWLGINIKQSKKSTNDVQNKNSITKKANTIIASKKNRPPLKRTLPTIQDPNGDDIFDIFNFDYLEKDNFGVPKLNYPNNHNDCNTTTSSFISQQSDDEQQQEYDEKAKELVSNENFDFIEACQNLKDDILSRHTTTTAEATNFYSDHNNDEGTTSTEINKQQVTLFDCQQSKGKCPKTSSEDNSSLSISQHTSTTRDDFLNTYQAYHENDIGKHDCDTVQNNVVTNEKQEQQQLSNDNAYEILLASGSNDSSAWIWDIKTGSCIQDLPLKSSSQSSMVNVCWLNENTLIVNTKSGDIVLWKLELLQTNSTGMQSNDDDIATGTAQVTTSKFKFVQDVRQFEHRGVTNFCKLKTCEIIWTLSTYREITCEDIANDKILAKYSCASLNTAAICQSPFDKELIAFASGDRRIGIIDVRDLQPTNVKIQNFSNRIESGVTALCWCPNNEDLLTFGTLEGRIGIFNLQEIHKAPIVLKPFFSKPIHSLEWQGNYIFACCNEKVAVYEWNEKQTKGPFILNITEASAICVMKNNYLIIGTKNGFINIFKSIKEEPIQFNKISSTLVSPKYISKIACNPLNSTKFAASSLANTIVIFSLVTQSGSITSSSSASPQPSSSSSAVSAGDGSSETSTILKIEKSLIMNDYSSGNSWVSWSGINENILLSCGFDGVIRIWDLTQSQKNELIFLKQYLSPMLCGIFSPLNENVVICAGKTTSIELFDITKEKSSTLLSKSNLRKNRSRLHQIDSVQWGTKAQITSESHCINKNREKKRKKKERKFLAGIDLSSDSEDLTSQLEKLALNQIKDGEQIDNDGSVTSEDESSAIITGNKCKNEVNQSGDITKETATIFRLITKEMNKEAIDCLLAILQNDSNATENDSNVSRKEVLMKKMFGSVKDVQTILDEELKFHQTFKNKSVAANLFPQIKGSLKNEIQKSIENKTLTSHQIALAPTISYSFWKTCCSAYAKQLIELGLILQATPYLLACHEIKDCIEQLIKGNYFREAWIIGKLYREHDDPILTSVLEKWIDYLVKTGNLEAAAFICGLSERYKQCREILLKIRQLNKNHEEILNILNQRLEKI